VATKLQLSALSAIIEVGDIVVVWLIAYKLSAMSAIIEKGVIIGLLMSVTINAHWEDNNKTFLIS